MAAWLAALWLSAAPEAAAPTARSLPAARPCTASELNELTAEATTPFRLICRAVLTSGQSIRRPLLIEGAEASGAGLDCQGGTVGHAGVATTTRQPTIAIWSRRITAAHWSRPTDIRIQNCVIHGAVRVWGMGADGGYDDLRASSRTAAHTATTQGAAPSHIALDRVTIVGTGSIPLYVGPGVTRLSLTHSTLAGRSDATALYLDAESADNRIENNTIAVATRREAVAVDGSARNRITGNRFDLGGRGGVFLYRNCGERGVIRHQTPSDNQITDNVFSGAAQLRPQLVVVGSREGRRAYCSADRGYPWGSSADDGDRATGNIVARNLSR
ncbi:right-handed parallel beta-helix repeat-containing protein [uncultured Brevundimonas sp.]|uniref:right-handed parallel beta-helix repeat-containing protein n=1 Tax=uncultured Brevundimonas sp. TaxID=213418 RepID=UPI0025CF887F|nr:right-handed parallel beta-helix repeat-containing protein [uncultured Brevundimonas sp.]